MAAPENLPATMTAIEISSPGSADVLKPAARPLPQPGPDDVLIKVAAAGVNRPDILQRKGGYPAPPGVTDIPGLEIAGTVVALGSKVTAWKIGDDVCALVAGGGICHLLRGASCPMPAYSVGIVVDRSGGFARNFFHGVDQCV